MRIREILILGTLFVVGCATATETYIPDGSKGYSINCSGTALTWGSCYEKAGGLCEAKGYDIITGGSQQGFVASASQFVAFGGSVMNRSMLIKCKN